MRHELTEKLLKTLLESYTDKVETTIALWLSKKADELDRLYCQANNIKNKPDTKDILGLEELKECGLGAGFKMPESLKPKKSREWPCGHIRAYSCNGKNPKNEWLCGSYGYFYNEPKFCLECGAKRPEEKKLEDELADYMNDNVEVGANWHKKASKDALKFLRERNLLKDM